MPTRQTCASAAGVHGVTAGATAVLTAVTNDGNGPPGIGATAAGSVTLAVQIATVGWKDGQQGGICALIEHARDCKNDLCERGEQQQPEHENWKRGAWRSAELLND